MDNLLTEFRSFLEEAVEHAVERKLHEVLPKAIKKANRSGTMSAQDVMKELNINSYSKLKRLRDKGILSYIQEDGHIIYPTESVDRYKKDHLIEGKY